MSITVITSRGQTTVPRNIRERLRLVSGSKVDWRIEEDGTARVIPKTLRPRDVCGWLANKPRKRKKLTLREMDEAIAQAARTGRL